MNKLLEQIAEQEKTRQMETFSIDEYLEELGTNKNLYSTAPERLLKAIGEPVIIDTTRDPRYGVIFAGKFIKTYAKFQEKFFGIELAIERFVNVLTSAAQGLEARKQIFLLNGDVGSGKSSFAEEIKRLMEQEAVYVLAAEDGTISPMFDNPLGLFLNSKHLLQDQYNIADRYFPAVLSPWAIQRTIDYKGNLGKFKIVKMYPSKATQTMIAKTEPMDPNNADQATLIGEVNMRMLQFHAQNHPDAYNYSGALCRGNRGLVEMAEALKTDVKVLAPLLDASQGKCFNGLKQVGSLPFDGIIFSHTNMAEYNKFMDEPTNAAIKDRVCVINFPYSLRYTESSAILHKMINESSLRNAPAIAETFDILAKFDVLTKLELEKVPNLYSKLRVYNGDNIQNEDNNAYTYKAYKDLASQNEGLHSFHSIRDSFKVLELVYNNSHEETSADPITLFAVLRDFIIAKQHPQEIQERYLNFIKEWLEPKYVIELERIIQRAYMESYSEFAQAKFDRYFHFAQAWVMGNDYNDPVTGIRMDKEKLHKELQILEHGAQINNYKDFRGEIVLYIITQKSLGIDVKWSSYKVLAKVIESSVFKSMQEILPIISFGTHTSEKEQKSHDKFLENMRKLGYTELQVKNLVGYYCNRTHS